MSAIREAKPLIYYLIRRGWHDQLLRLCDGIAKKGKDPVTMFWKAYAHGMSGDIMGSISQLESFASRKDMQFPISLALKYFRSRMANPDQDAIDQLNSEIAVAEDVTKEPGKILAARFALFTGDIRLASRVAQGLLEGCRGQSPSTPFELEAACIEQWIVVMEAQTDLNVAQASGQRTAEDDVLKRLDRLDDDVAFLNDQGDIDSFMLRAKAKLIAKQNGETLNILNQVIATFPQFLPALTEKALLLASAGEWEQALDMTQRVLDQERQNIDAMQILTVHALTQEYQPNDSLQKLEDLDEALGTLEPSSVECPLAVAEVISAICSRQPRALQICLRMLDRALRKCATPVEEAKVLNQMGRVHLMQGPSEHANAMTRLRDATKRDPENVQILEGLISVQLEGGLYEDAEAQIEMLSVMQSAEDASPEFFLLQSLVARLGSKKSMTHHLNFIEDARDLFFRRAARSGDALKAPFYDLVLLSPDFMTLLAVEFLRHMEPPMPISVLSSSTAGMSADGSTEDEDGNGYGSSNNPVGGLAALSGGVFGGSSSGEGHSGMGSNTEAGRAVEAGVDLLTNVLKLCPGIMCAYIELARCHMAQGMYEEASRVLHQCLALQPHCSAALVALAKVEVLRLNASAADRSLEHALSCDFSVRSVHLFRLVQATVRAQQGRIDEAIKEIEALMALPEIQQGPAYRSSSGALDEPDAFRGMGVKPKTGKDGTSSGSSGGSGTMHTDSLRLTEDDRVGAFIVYASLLSKARRLKEGNKVLSEAKMAFAGTPQEVQVLVAASHLAVERKDFDTAIRTLDKIAPDNPTYKRAQMIKAEVYLVYQRDKEKFVNCYNQLVGRDGSSQNYALLGEAYLRILNPEKAVEALEVAYKMDQSNSRLRARIGRALVATHEYHRAVKFYEDAIREVAKSAKASAGNSNAGGGANNWSGAEQPTKSASAAARSYSSEAVLLSHDLAKLFLKLGKPESSSRVLEGILHNDHRDIFDMRQDVATLLLLVDVHKINAPKDVTDTLLKAKAVQKDLLNQVRSDVTLSSSSEVVEAERLALSSICERLGSCFVASSMSSDSNGADKDDAEAAFREAIQHNPHNVKAMLGLAKIHKRNGESDLCQAQCQKVISAEPSNEEATIMLSELLFVTMASDPSGAVNPLRNLLQEHPNNYKALSNLITLLRKTGRLDEVPAFISAAEKKDRRSASHAGLHFCKGLYARHTNAIGVAISEFNLARRDETWGHDALVHMIELYLNPDQEGVWQSEDAMSSSGDGAGEGKESGPSGGDRASSSSSSSVLDEATIGNIQAAEILLKELQPKARDPMRFRVLESYCALASRQKHNVDRAMQTFIDLLETDQDYLPAVLGMATGFMVEKAAHKARNLLKRVAKMEQANHDGEDFQKANLLLAKFYVDKSKYDLAQELCTKCLASDKSCSQAWEIMALIKEKDVNYLQASECYEKAWKLEFEASAAVGFKLAFSYLKSKKYVQAIDVAERVLDQYPDYPRIREEILKKALLGIRTTN